MKGNLVAHRIWHRFYLAGLMASLVLFAAGIGLFYLSNSWDGLVSSLVIRDAISVAAALSPATFLFSLIVFPITRWLVGPKIALHRVVLAYPLLAEFWYLTTYLTLRLFEGPLDQRNLPEIENVAAFAGTSFVQGLLIYWIFTLTYRFRPVATIDKLFE